MKNEVCKVNRQGVRRNTGFKDVEGNELLEGDIIRVWGRVFVGSTSDFSIHEIKYFDKGEHHNLFGGIPCFVGLDIVSELGKPSINKLNQKWIDKNKIEKIEDGESKEAKQLKIIIKNYVSMKHLL